jgi:molybdate transport system ATP-binding protein
MLSLTNVILQLDSFTLEASLEAKGPVTAIFGRSGAGKTSLLDIIAGLLTASSGSIQHDEIVLMDIQREVFVPPRFRRIGYVPQDLALFPHLTVNQNLRFGYKADRNRAFTLEHIVELLEIGALLERRAMQISGGEKQRVALARALLASPRLLLLDEPLASLDHALKLKILPYLVRIRDEFRIPMLYVTHDRFETLSLANEMVVMHSGKIVQAGAVQEVFNRPANLVVAGILTIETIQPGEIINHKADMVTVAVGKTLLSSSDPELSAGVTHVHVCIRAEDVILMAGPDAPSSARNHLPGTVNSVAREGALVRVDLDCGFPLVSLITKQAAEELKISPGKPVLALVKAPHVHLIAR